MVEVKEGNPGLTYVAALDWAIDRAGDAERDDVILALEALAEYVQEARLDDEG